MTAIIAVPFWSVTKTSLLKVDINNVVKNMYIMVNIINLFMFLF